LALHYTLDSRKDRFGNLFRYRAAVNPDREDGESKDGRWDYDVFLTIGVNGTIQGGAPQQ